MSASKRDRICLIDGCEKTYWRRDLCKMHWTRWYRHGDPLIRLKRGLPAGGGKGYVPAHGYMMKGGGHPLAGARGVVRLHRAILFDAIGYGPHLCAHCGCPLSWKVDLVIDHLDANRLNNDLSNLVPSCQPCNARRSAKPRPRCSLPECDRAHYGRGLCCLHWTRVYKAEKRAREAVS